MVRVNSHFVQNCRRHTCIENVFKKNQISYKLPEITNFAKRPVYQTEFYIYRTKCETPPCLAPYLGKSLHSQDRSAVPLCSFSLSELESALKGRRVKQSFTGRKHLVEESDPSRAFSYPLHFKSHPIWQDHALWHKSGEPLPDWFKHFCFVKCMYVRACSFDFWLATKFLRNLLLHCFHIP